MDDGSYTWDPDDNDSMMSDGNVSDIEGEQGSGRNKRFRRAANKVKIFSEAADYSHIKSKVNSTNPSMRPLKFKLKEYLFKLKKKVLIVGSIS